jgi:hypothetical protein
VRPEGSDFNIYGRVETDYDKLLQAIAVDLTGVKAERIQHLSIHSVTGRGMRVEAHHAFGVIAD